jgi:hypothetical protein
MSSNPVYQFLQQSPVLAKLRGWITVGGAVMTILFGISGLLTGHLDAQVAFGIIAAGVMGLGLGNKGDKILQGLKRIAELETKIEQLTGTQQ